MELSPIHPASPSFSQLEYDLQSLSKASTLRITQAWEISNPNLTVQFDRRSRNLLILDSWIDAVALKQPNLEADLIKKGFQISGNVAASQGITFPVGSIDLVDSSGVPGRIKKRMIYCKVAVGRAFCVSDPSSLLENIPDGYDSFYLDPEATEKSTPSPLENLDFCKEAQHLSSPLLSYVVKDSAQALPRFIVEFEFDPKAEKQSRQKSICENCETVLASIYCQADSAHLCEKCDVEIHRSKLASRHVRISLEKGPQCVVSCRIHPERNAEFFCPTCHVLVCLNCKMVGHHSTGEAVRHPLVAVTEAYQSVIESAHAPDPLIEERQLNLKGQLQKISKKGQSVLLNAKLVREQIEEIYKKAMADLNGIVNRRLIILKGDAQEYKRLLGEISRIKDYLEYLETGRDATLFLLSWHQYLQAKADLPLLPSGDKENKSNEAPLHVSGSITIQNESRSMQTLSPGSNDNTNGNNASSAFSLAPMSSSNQDHYHQRSQTSQSFAGTQYKLSPGNPPTFNSRSRYASHVSPLSSGKESPGATQSDAGTGGPKKATDIFTEALQSLDLSPPMSSK